MLKNHGTGQSRHIKFEFTYCNRAKRMRYSNRIHLMICYFYFVHSTPIIASKNTHKCTQIYKICVPFNDATNKSDEKTFINYLFDSIPRIIISSRSIIMNIANKLYWTINLPFFSVFYTHTHMTFQRLCSFWIPNTIIQLNSERQLHFVLFMSKIKISYKNDTKINQS